MRSSINALISSLFVFTAITSLGQSDTKKYVKRNSKAPTIKYGADGIYARGLHVDTGVIFIGNSNGSIYMYDTDTDSSELMLKFPSFTEVRDIERCGDYLYGMQSGDDGKFVKMNERGPVGFVEYPEWKGRFFDAFDFNGDVGFLMGDPVDGKFTLYHTTDGGKKWMPCEGQLAAFKGEAGFAASGSNVHVMNDSTYMFISGGMRSNFFKSTNNGKTWIKVELPYYPGETIGAYSMCFEDDTYGVIVGGNYKQPSLKMNTTYYTYDGGATWFNSMNPPKGYRSCVYHVNGVYYACGRTGIDFSLNKGEDWTPFAEGTFFALTSVGNQLIATMRDGQFKSFNLIK
jgi:hypothetical protein